MSRIKILILFSHWDMAAPCDPFTLPQPTPKTMTELQGESHFLALIHNRYLYFKVFTMCIIPSLFYGSDSSQVRWGVSRHSFSHRILCFRLPLFHKVSLQISVHGFSDLNIALNLVRTWINSPFLGKEASSKFGKAYKFSSQNQVLCVFVCMCIHR